MKYTEEQLKELKLNNKYIKDIKNNRIYYTSKFKEEYDKMIKKWIHYKQIYELLWFPEYIINSTIPKESYKTWKKKNKKLNNTNWNIKIKQNKKNENINIKLEKQKKSLDMKNADLDNMTDKEKKEYIEYLETQVAYLKELNEYINRRISKIIKFGIIYKLSEKYDIKKLCKIAEVSISWYYKHRKLILTNNTKEERERKDLNDIKEIFYANNEIYWYRRITMELNRNKSKKIKVKKVKRLMHEYWLKSKIRKKKVNDEMKKINKEAHNNTIFPNILKRKFRWNKVWKKFWTDITYLWYNWKIWKKCYLSILKDITTWEIVSHVISDNLGMEIVLDTINWATINLRWCIIHSDQWWHYRSYRYQSLLRSKWIKQSMSRKWQCLDNAPTESFFWYMKDEIDIKSCKTFKEVEKIIDDYIIYYNNYRPQWNRNKMTPIQYKEYLESL